MELESQLNKNMASFIIRHGCVVNPPDENDYLKLPEFSVYSWKSPDRMDANFTLTQESLSDFEKHGIDWDKTSSFKEETETKNHGTDCSGVNVGMLKMYIVAANGKGYCWATEGNTEVSFSFLMRLLSQNLSIESAINDAKHRLKSIADSHKDLIHISDMLLADYSSF